jgi:hypothetical protein
MVLLRIDFERCLVFFYSFCRVAMLFQVDAFVKTGLSCASA